MSVLCWTTREPRIPNIFRTLLDIGVCGIRPISEEGDQHMIDLLNLFICTVILNRSRLFRFRVNTNGKCLRRFTILLHIPVILFVATSGKCASLGFIKHDIRACTIYYKPKQCISLFVFETISARRYFLLRLFPNSPSCQTRQRRCPSHKIF